MKKKPMKNRIFQIVYLTFLLALGACGNDSLLEDQDLKPQQISPESDSIAKVRGLNTSIVVDTLVIRELFEDSTRIGRSGKNKISIVIYTYLDASFIKLNFYSKRRNSWLLRNNYTFESDLIGGIQPVIEDFNSDGKKDIHCWLSAAARGSNQVRRLFIYSPSGDSLIHIVNSYEYPNMVYNSRLNCIDALLIHGCSSQVFGRISGDSLVDIAYLETRDNHTAVNKVDSGYPTLIHADSSNRFGCYSRFVSYSPLVLYSNDPSIYTFEKTNVYPSGGKIVPFYLWRKRLEL